MLSLLRADFFKLYKGGTLLWLWGFLVLFVVANMLLGALISPTNVAFPFPNSLLVAGSIMQSVGILLLIVFSAEVVGSEYSNDTWKNLLTRHAGRFNFIFSKWLTLMISIVAGLVMMLLCALALGFVLQTTLRLAGHASALSLGNALLFVLAQSGIAVVAAVITMLGVVIGRSHIAGIVIVIVWVIFDQSLSQLLTGAWKGVSFIQASTSLQAHLVGIDTPYAVVQDLLVVAAYLVVPMLLASYIFRQRDIL